MRRPMLPDALRPWVTWAALALSLAWCAHRARALRPWPLALPSRPRVALAALLVAASVAASWALTDHLPVHDHNTYVARFDHAFALDDRDPRRGWNPVAFHLWHLALQAVPYRLAAVSALGVAVSALAHALLYLFAHALLAPRMRRAGADAALWALAFAALHPAAVRVAAGSTFWPLPMALLFAGGLAALLARETGDVVDALAAAALLTLAALGPEVYLVLLPLAALAGRGRARLASMAVTLALSAPYLAPSLRRAFGRGGAALHQGPARALADALRGENLYLDPRVTPLAVGALLLAGAWALWPHRRAVWPLAWALLATEYFLASQVSLYVGYPTRFIQGASSLHLLALVAGAGAGWVMHRGSRPGARGVALALAVVATSPWCRASWGFLREPRPLGVELRAISSRLGALPPHDALVLAPTTMPRLVRAGEDPVEAYFPTGEYLEAMRGRGVRPALLGLDDALRGATWRGRALVYVGATLRAFSRAEVAAGAVPPTRERPMLTALRARYTLTPASVFRVPTRDHPAVTLRLDAGGEGAVTLGFYWLDPR